MLEAIIIVVWLPFVSALQPMPGGWRTVLRRTTVMQPERTAKAMLIPIRQQYQGMILSFTKHTNNDNIYQH